jgi:hypothetical protein
VNFPLNRHRATNNDEPTSQRANEPTSQRSPPAVRQAIDRSISSRQREPSIILQATRSEPPLIPSSRRPVDPVEPQQANEPTSHRSPSASTSRPSTVSRSSYLHCFLWWRHQHPPRRLRGGDSPTCATSKGESQQRCITSKGGNPPKHHFQRLIGHQATADRFAAACSQKRNLSSILPTPTRATPPRSPQPFQHFSFFTNLPWQPNWCFLPHTASIARGGTWPQYFFFSLVAFQGWQPAPCTISVTLEATYRITYVPTIHFACPCARVC